MTEIRDTKVRADGEKLVIECSCGRNLETFEDEEGELQTETVFDGSKSIGKTVVESGE